jgi:hypothetical protein
MPGFFIGAALQTESLGLPGPHLSLPSAVLARLRWWGSAHARRGAGDDAAATAPGPQALAGRTPCSVEAGATLTDDLRLPEEHLAQSK